ncbi:bifunctional diguanylate cyclase/phosphodiesterase [Ectothiorhodospira mobilis]|uniref:sensor domain-containing protein n=1 Tax=Ectothiorhodospira mobilis TaxID=195064 RepID=UPI001EE9A083|nr:diguanylate cyclase [Ectothiorhodospira mobilis]
MSCGDTQAQRTRFLYEGLPASLPVSLAAGLVLVATHWTLLPAPLMLGWLALLTAAAGLRGILWAGFRRARRRGEDADPCWLQRFRLGALAMGIAWALGALLLTQSGDMAHQFLLAFAMAGISAGVLLTLATDRVSALLVVAPMLTALGLGMQLQEQGMPTVSGGIILLFLAFVALTSGRMQQRFEENFRLRQEAEEQRAHIRDNELRWRFALDGSGQGLWDWDLATGRVYYSPQWVRLLGHPHDPGRPSLELRQTHIHPEDRARVERALDRHLRGIVPRYECEYRMRRADGGLIWVHDRGRVVTRTPRGDALRFIGVLQDISRRKRVETVLREERRLFATGPVALLVWEGMDKRRVVYASANIRDLLGYGPGELYADSFSFADLVHPQDMMQLLQDTPKPGQDQVEQSYRLRHRSGAYHWFYDITRADRDEQGRVLRLRGYLFDQTRIKRMEQALARSERRNRALLEALPDLVLRFDSQGRYLDWHAGNAGMLYVPPERFLHRSLFDVLPAAAAQRLYEGIHQVLLHGRMQVVEYTLEMEDGRHQSFEARLVRLGDDEVLAVVRDVTAQKQATARISHMAFHDALTQLPNRRLIQDRIRHAMEHGQRHGRYGALLFLDLDHFKALNDSHGHAVGDRLLQQVAARLKGCLRESDTVARLGGDEFVVLLEGLDRNESLARDQALQAGHKILKSLSLPYELGDLEYIATPSIGLCLFRGEGLEVDELMRRADRAMYQVKKAGRNGLRLFQATATPLPDNAAGRN